MTEIPATADDAKTVEALVGQILADKQQPVVVFALEWCEFCWSVLKLFKQSGIDFRTVNLDSAEYQKENLGRKIRNHLKTISNCETIPQIFVGGEFIGGCTETFDAFQSGELKEKLQHCGVTFEQQENFNPYSLLPEWLQPR